MWFSGHTQICPPIKFENAFYPTPEENTSTKLHPTSVLGGVCPLLRYSARSAKTRPQSCWFSTVITFFVWSVGTRVIPGSMSTFQGEGLHCCQPRRTEDVWFLSVTHILSSAQWKVMPSCQNNHSFQLCSQWPTESLRKPFISQRQVFKGWISGSKSRRRFILQNEMRFPQHNEMLYANKIKQEKLTIGIAMLAKSRACLYAVRESHFVFWPLL